jgi:hypothetical protein
MAELTRLGYRETITEAFADLSREPCLGAAPL